MVPITLPGPVYNLLRTALQSAWGLLVGHFAVLQLIPADAVVGWVISFVVIGAIAGAVHWLETRTGDGTWPKLARWVAKIAMLGLGKSPTYGTSAKTGA